VALKGATFNQALARGSLQGPAGSILPCTSLEALYASIPVYFPDEFAECKTTAGNTHFVWLIPAFPSEAEFVVRHGWEHFEEFLVRQQPALLDLNRDELRLSVLREVSD
jgi:hypothetical protein